MTEPSRSFDGPASKLVIVTGSGRSGTSTASGTLKKLGLYIPQPEIRANSSNPRGFFEPRWAVDFHKRVLSTAGVRTLDARPEASALAARVASDTVLQEELRTWLATQLKGPQIVVKDPRAFWLKDLWVPVAESLGLLPSFLTMLRHPAEVVGSRDMHYLQNASVDQRRERETGNVAGWVNVTLANERATRGHPRAFAHYIELVSDWRTTMKAVAKALELTYDADLDSRAQHEVDDFIDASLHRAQLTWDDLDVPNDLQVLAEDTWTALSGLSDASQDRDSAPEFDELTERYVRLHSYAAALVRDHTRSAVDAARKRAFNRGIRQGKSHAMAAVADNPSLSRRVIRKVRSLRSGK